MKKLLTTRLFLCSVIVCAALCAIFPMNLVSAAIIAQNSSWSWDDTVWTLDDSGVLTIYGEGPMNNYIQWHGKNGYGASVPPWVSDAVLSVVIQDGVTSIGSGAFCGCKNLSDVHIPDSVTRIGEYAFGNCKSLKSIYFPDSVEEIGDAAFSGCQMLESFRIPSGISKIGENIFDLCPRMTSLRMPDTIRPLKPAESNNRRDEYDYIEYHAFPVKSYLYQDGENLVRVEYIGGQIVAETYSGDFKLLSSRTIASDLQDIWGGFYAGRDYNFLIFGKKNWNEDKYCKVVSVIKYDKSWNRLGQADLRDANTVVPFEAGSLRCDEYNGVLYIHTCHQMYKSDDWLNHQANMTLAIRESDMTFADAQYEVTYKYGYVSHSFDQFLHIDQNHNIVTLDKGDAYPRAVILQRYHKKAGGRSFAGQPAKVEILRFPDNNVMYQKTGASLGGLAETANFYMTAFSYDGVGGGDDCRAKNVFLSSTSKSNFSASGTKMLKLTNYPVGGTYSAGIPVIVSAGAGGGYVVWDVCEKDGKGDYRSKANLAYVRYYADGQVSDIMHESGRLSDCQPILFNGKYIWYVTENSVPVFFTLDDLGISAHKAYR